MIEEALESEKETAGETLKKPPIKNRYGIKTMGDFRQTHQE
jgi:hypothetical protein